MLCKDTAMMIGGGLLAGYGVAKSMSEKNALSKIDVIGPLVGGIAILGYGFMNSKKESIKVPRQMMVDDSMPSLQQGHVPTPLSTRKPLKVMANYAGVDPTQAIIKSSGNASYDKNHVYPGII